MREIKFRGKQKDWEYGGFVKYSDGRCLIINEKGEFEVDENSVGQFTGLCDESGTEIYENDIVKIGTIEPTIKVVKYMTDGGRFIMENETWFSEFNATFSNGDVTRDDRVQIIGNPLDYGVDVIGICFIHCPEQPQVLGKTSAASIYPATGV